MLTPNELVFTFGGSYVCANFGENRSRNTTVIVPTDGQTDWQTQTDFIICSMLYAIDSRHAVDAVEQVDARFFSPILRDVISCDQSMWAERGRRKSRPAFQPISVTNLRDLPVYRFSATPAYRSAPLRSTRFSIRSASRSATTIKLRSRTNGKQINHAIYH